MKIEFDLLNKTLILLDVISIKDLIDVADKLSMNLEEWKIIPNNTDKNVTSLPIYEIFGKKNYWYEIPPVTCTNLKNI